MSEPITDPVEKPAYRPPTGSDVWNRAVSTIQNMCLADMMGVGPTKEAFVMTLRLYADEMEKLLHPNAEAQRSPAAGDKLPPLVGQSEDHNGQQPRKREQK